MKKTVLMVGQVGWEGGLAACYQRAFESCGCSFEAFDLEAERARIAPAGRVGRSLMAHLDLSAFNRRANLALVRRVMDAQPDVLVVICNEAVRPASLLQIKVACPATQIVNIYPDTPFNMPDFLLTALPLYDVFCTHTRAALPHLQRLGCRDAFYLPLAADPVLHSPPTLSAEETKTFASELVYVGNWRAEHEALLDTLREFDLAIWGSTYWGSRTQRAGWVRERWQGRPLLSGAEYAKAHGGAKICLNPIDPLNFPSHNQRLFEVPACGGFSLVTRTPEVLELFSENENVVCFGDAEELKEKIRYYLQHEDERRKIATCAYEHVVKGGHTYSDRVRALLKHLDDESGA